jgi:hypothetical protein
MPPTTSVEVFSSDFKSRFFRPLWIFSPHFTQTRARSKKQEEGIKSKFTMVRSPSGGGEELRR